MKRPSYTLPARLDQAARKETGAFYTPDLIVDFMVERLLKGRSLPLRICDFACGGGAFLAGVLRYVRKNAPEKYEACAGNLTGIDINPEAVALARSALPDIPPENIICADTLELELSPSERFDIIVGNPPYLCGGVKNNLSFPPARQRELKSRFPDSFEYKMNLFALFMEQSTRMADEFSLIVPDSLLCGRYFSRLRRFLASGFQLREIFLLEKPNFDAAPGNAVIIHARRGSVPEVPSLSCGCFREKDIREGRISLHLNDQRRFLKETRCRFQLAYSPIEERLAEKLLSSPLRVRDEFHIASGIISRRGKKSIVTDRPGEKTAPAIVYGREIHPFEVRREGFFLKLEKENIKSGLDHKRYAGEKIFIRQTGCRLIAAVSREKLYALNNCHTGTPSGEFPADTLAALLNSAPLNFLYRYLSGERNRNFAQIDIDLLNELPLISTPEFDLFAAECAKNPAAREKLDPYCGELFGLTPEETALTAALQL